MFVYTYVGRGRWVGDEEGEREEIYEGGTTHLLIHLFVVYFIIYQFLTPSSIFLSFLTTESPFSE